MQHKIFVSGIKSPLIVSDGEQYMIEVRGLILCKGVKSGKYRIKISNYHGSGTATLYRPRGTKPLARHLLDDLMFMTMDCTDFNGTVIVEKYPGP